MPNFESGMGKYENKNKLSISIDFID